MTTTKKPTTKNLHYGGDSGFPPRGRRTLGDPRRNPRRRRPLGRNVVGSVADQRRRDREALRNARVKGRGTMIDFSKLPPAQQARIRKQQEANKKRYQQMTPTMRRRLMEQMRRAQQRATPYTSSVGRQTPAQQKAARDKFNKMMEANKRMRANVFGRGRKPTQATQTPKNVLDRFADNRDRFNKRRRPTGTPVPQLVPQQRRDRLASPTQQVREAIAAPPSSYPAQEVRQAIPEPMQRPRGRRVAAKGGVITKKRIGANDFRKGGYVLSTVDNRKNKK